jgi:hypothetical protein
MDRGLVNGLRDFTGLVFPRELTEYVALKAGILYSLFDGLGNRSGKSIVQLKCEVAMELTSRNWDAVKLLPSPKEKWDPVAHKARAIQFPDDPELDDFSPLLIYMLDRDVLKGANRYTICEATAARRL